MQTLHILNFFLQKYSWMDDSGTRSEKSFEEEEIRKQIEVLDTEIELRYTLLTPFMAHFESFRE